MTPAVGGRLGHFEILASLGAGRMGVVYRARDTRLGRDVALKVLPEAFARDTGRLARFDREARVLATLNHPGIAAIHGLETGDDGPVLVMELVEKPSNIKLTPEDQVKLLDFGLAKALASGDDAEGETQSVDGAPATGVVVGTAPYMSPEQARGEALDPRRGLPAPAPTAL